MIPQHDLLLGRPILVIIYLTYQCVPKKATTTTAKLTTTSCNTCTQVLQIQLV